MKDIGREGPFKSAFEADIDGVIRREIVSYRKVQSSEGSMLVKETCIRNYFTDDDYTDESCRLPLERITWVKITVLLDI